MLELAWLDYVPRRPFVSESEMEASECMWTHPGGRKVVMCRKVPVESVCMLQFIYTYT